MKVQNINKRKKYCKVYSRHIRWILNFKSSGKHIPLYNIFCAGFYSLLRGYTANCGVTIKSLHYILPAFTVYGQTYGHSVKYGVRYAILISYQHLSRNHLSWFLPHSSAQCNQNSPTHNFCPETENNDFLFFKSSLKNH